MALLLLQDKVIKRLTELISRQKSLDNNIKKLSIPNKRKKEN
jgi:hypothetical protein